MTLGEFRTLVLAYAQVEGQPYLTAAADVDSLLNEKLREFAKRTLCLYTPSAAFALQSGVSTYYLEGTTDPVVTSGTTEFVRINHVILNSLPLYDPIGKMGQTDHSALIAEDPNYMETAAGTPTRWVLLPGSKILLAPKPSAAFLTTSSGKNFVSGWTFPATLVDDADELSIPIDIQRTAAIFCAAELIGPYASGSSLEKYGRLLSIAEAKMREIRNEYDRVYMPPVIKGLRTSGRRMPLW